MTGLEGGHGPPMQEAEVDWISTKDRLPEDMDYVLTWGPERHRIGFYHPDSELWRLADRWASREMVTHWTPLPEPPSEPLGG